MPLAWEMMKKVKTGHCRFPVNLNALAKIVGEGFRDET